MEALAMRVRDPSNGEEYEVNPRDGVWVPVRREDPPPADEREPPKFLPHKRPVIIDGIARGEARWLHEVLELLEALGFDGMDRARSIIGCRKYHDRFELTTETGRAEK